MRRRISLLFISVLFLIAWLGAPAPASAAPTGLTVYLPSVTRESKVIATGTAPPGATVQSDRSSVTVPADLDGLFFLPLDLTEGDNKVTISADLNGTTQTYTKTVTVNPKAPPLDVRVVRTANLYKLDFEGFTQPGVTVTVNGKAVTVDEQGHFTSITSTGDMAPDLVVTATDAAGNRSEYITHVNLSRLSVVDYRTSARIGYSTRPGNKIAVEYSQGMYEPRTAFGEVAVDNKGQGSVTLPIAFGSNMYWFNVTTPEGVTYTELVDRERPVEIALPYRTNVPDILITGRMTKNGKLTINGDPVTPDQDGNFAYMLHLKLGAQSVKVRVESLMLGSFEYTDTVTLLAPNRPMQGSTLRFYGEESGAVFTVGGQSYKVDVQGQVVIPLPLSVGENLVSLPFVRTNGELRVNLFNITYYPGRLVVMQIGKDQADVDGTTQTMPVAPQLLGGSTYVPLRYLADTLGAAVDWDAETGTATYTKEGHVIKITLGEATATVDGKSVALPAPAQMVNGRTMVPLRFVSENLGVHLYWDGPTSTIFLYIPQP